MVPLPVKERDFITLCCCFSLEETLDSESSVADEFCLVTVAIRVTGPLGGLGLSSINPQAQLFFGCPGVGLLITPERRQYIYMMHLSFYNSCLDG